MTILKQPRRAVMAASIVIVGIAGLAACSAPPSQGSSADSITVWTGLPYDSFQVPNTENFERCEEETGISVELQDFPPGELTGKVLQAATSNDLPDLLYLEGTDLTRVAETGVLTDLADYDITAEGYDAKLQQMGTYDGTLYGVAPGVNTVGMFYNKGMFAEAGVEVPTTFAELRDVAAKLTTPDRMGLALSAGSGAGPYVFLPFLLSAGGDPSDLTTPEAAEALQLWKDLVSDGSTSSSAVTWDWDAQDYFREGKAAMVMSGSWLFNEAEGLGIDLGVFPIPSPDGSGPSRSPIGAELWTIPVTDDAHQAAAAEVLSCITNDENALIMAEQSRRTPGDTSVGEDYAAEFPEEAPLVALIPDSYLRDPELNGKQTEQLTYAIQDAIANGTEPEEALEKASEQ
ncbi:sugar ABC transporter substrate-binding protein [Agromyces albus]|uniref:sugar ABC transporter substrate-binding protein n=1 Tax=Agromyces albus TaxID=205332 RepID=UPI00277F7A1E|nr:sugar ABC transporter substrate-binding protein [Agromyces albus]MDQ0573832.1 multiple sugar transport system substrate-binding protein [Agromyces albus]